MMLAAESDFSVAGPISKFGNSCVGSVKQHIEQSASNGAGPVCTPCVHVLKIGGSGGWGSGLIGGGRGVAPLLGGCSSGGRYRVSVCVMVVDWFAKIACRVW